MPTGSFWARRIRPYITPRSLSARVLWLTITIILMVELIILMPSLGREREQWLWSHITQAHLAAFTVATADEGSKLTPQTQHDLLKLSDTEAIKLLRPGKNMLLLQAHNRMSIGGQINLDTETLAASIWRSDLAIIGLQPAHLLVTATSPLDATMQVQIIVSGHALADHLRAFAGRIAALSVIIALITGLLVFAALDKLLVRPMRVITAHIVGFRNDPEHAGLTDLTWLNNRPEDEISLAARELAAMQDELRAALWRNARLAALGTSVAKISHDLRNILTSALLVADRLQATADPVVKHAASTLITAVERAAELVKSTVDFAREGPPAITRAPVALRDLADEACLMVRSGEPNLLVENLIPGSLTLPLDRSQIYRVLVNLMRNAAEAGATSLTLTIETESTAPRLVLADNGPGLPRKVQDKLFQPFMGTGRRGGTGLGLAIARDLVRAHGGDLSLRGTGPQGTVFVMGLAASELTPV